MSTEPDPQTFTIFDALKAQQREQQARDLKRALPALSRDSINAILNAGVQDG